MPTVLTLAPAFGGGRFGPFAGPVTIGTAASCQVLVGDAPGVRPVHARLTERPGGWRLEPGAPGAVLFAARNGRVGPANGPVDLAPGDSFMLGGRDGVAFVVSVEGVSAGTTGASGPRARASSGQAASRGGGTSPVARPGAAARPSGPVARPPSGPRRGPPSTGDLASEARRQLEVEAMRIGPVQQLRTLLFRAQGGTLLRPHVIVGALFALGGSALVACAGVAAWVLAHLH